MVTRPEPVLRWVRLLISISIFQVYMNWDKIGSWFSTSIVIMTRCNPNENITFHFLHFDLVSVFNIKIHFFSALLSQALIIRLII